MGVIPGVPSHTVWIDSKPFLTGENLWRALHAIEDKRTGLKNMVDQITSNFTRYSAASQPFSATIRRAE
jgi:hypothetical protein